MMKHIQFNNLEKENKELKDELKEVKNQLLELKDLLLILVTKEDTTS